MASFWEKTTRLEVINDPGLGEPKFEIAVDHTLLQSLRRLELTGVVLVDISRPSGPIHRIAPHYLDIDDSSKLYDNLKPAFVKSLRLRGRATPAFTLNSYSNLRVLVTAGRRMQQTISGIDCPQMTILELGAFSFWGARANIPFLESLITLRHIDGLLDPRRAVAKPLPLLKSLTFKLHKDRHFRMSFPNFLRNSPSLTSVRVFLTSVPDKKDLKFFHEALFHPVAMHQATDQESPRPILAPSLCHFDLVLPAQILLDQPDSLQITVKFVTFMSRSREDLRVGWHFYAKAENDTLARKVTMFREILEGAPFGGVRKSTVCFRTGDSIPSCLQDMVARGRAFGPLGCT